MASSNNVLNSFVAVTCIKGIHGFLYCLRCLPEFVIQRAFLGHSSALPTELTRRGACYNTTKPLIPLWKGISGNDFGKRVEAVL